MKKLLFISAFCLTSSMLMAQSTAQCARALTQAELAFEQGRLLYILDENQNAQFYQCLRNGSFTKEEEIRAHKLLTKAYLFTDNEVEAERKLVDLLISDKEHQLAPEDPAELHFLYSKFKTEPILRVAVRAGFNKTFITTLQSFNTFQTGDKFYNEKGSTTGLGIGQSIEVMAERHIAKGIEVGLGTQLRFATYEVDGQMIPDNLTYIAKNRSSMFRIPLLVRYNYGYDVVDANGVRKKLIPYAFLGGSFDMTMNAKYVETSRTGGTAFTLTDANSSLTDFDQVSKTNVSIFGGIGMKLRVGRALVDFFTMELRYDNSLFNYINPDNRWANDDVRFGIGHIEDDLTINTLTFSVGYTRSFYMPRKRKEYR